MIRRQGEEFNLAEHDEKVRTELLADLEQRLQFWDKGANAIPEYVWHVINAMKGSEKK